MTLGLLTNMSEKKERDSLSFSNSSPQQPIFDIVATIILTVFYFIVSISALKIDAGTIALCDP